MNVTVSNTDPRMLLRLRAIFGVGSVRVANRSGKRRRIFEWTVHTRQAVIVLEAVRPHLVVKGEQADIALAIMATIRHSGHSVDAPTANLRTELAARLRVLKHQEWGAEEVV